MKINNYETKRVLFLFLNDGRPEHVEVFNPKIQSRTKDTQLSVQNKLFYFL